MKTNLAPKPLVAVAWDDAFTIATGDYSEQDIIRDHHKPARYTTFGLLVYRNERGIMLACDYSEDGEYRGLNFIPGGMVVEVHDLGIPKPKRKRQARKPALKVDDGSISPNT